MRTFKVLGLRLTYDDTQTAARRSTVGLQGLGQLVQMRGGSSVRCVGHPESSRPLKIRDADGGTDTCRAQDCPEFVDRLAIFCRTRMSQFFSPTTLYSQELKD